MKYGLVAQWRLFASHKVMSNGFIFWRNCWGQSWLAFCRFVSSTSKKTPVRFYYSSASCTNSSNYIFHRKPNYEYSPSFLFKRKTLQNSAKYGYYHRKRKLVRCVHFESTRKSCIQPCCCVTQWLCRGYCESKDTRTSQPPRDLDEIHHSDVYSSAKKTDFESDNGKGGPTSFRKSSCDSLKSDQVADCSLDSELTLSSDYGSDFPESDVTVEETHQQKEKYLVSKSSEYVEKELQCAVGSFLPQSELKLTKADVKEILFAFCLLKEVKWAAKRQGLEGSLFLKCLRSFRRQAFSESEVNTDLQHTLNRIHSGGGQEDDLFPFFVDHAKQLFPGIAHEEELRKISDLSGPADLYPRARKIRRKIIYHVGPTNSGKTHAALERFSTSTSGVYCAPLRLLAAEVFRKTNFSGVGCDLTTGEERLYAVSADEPADHVACTVEMCSTIASYDCAVIDEIQMVRDRDRGWAWTRAFLGLVCPEVHVCGEETAVDLICRLAESCGEQVEIRRYDRLSPLKVLNYSLGDVSQVKPGDCIVAFSQKQLFRIRQSIEQFTGYKCAIVYGGLPPDCIVDFSQEQSTEQLTGYTYECDIVYGGPLPVTRTEQAQRFNDPNDEHCIMVASDAIGMGLNLNIKRLIFSTLEKYDGQSMVQLSVSQAKQIAGRAGRFGTEHDAGEVTTFRREDLGTLKEMLRLPSETVMTAGLAPTMEQIEMLSHQLPHSTLSTLFDVFTSMAQLDGGCYFMCDLGEKKFLAELTENVPLSIRDQYKFCQAPISLSSKPIVLSLAQKFAWLVSREEELTGNALESLIHWPPFRPKSLTHLQELGALHEVFDIYLWLSYRFEHIFVDHEGVQAMQQQLERVIGRAVSSNLGRRSKHSTSGGRSDRSTPGSKFDDNISKRSTYTTGKRFASLKHAQLGDRLSKHDHGSLKTATINQRPRKTITHKHSLRQQVFYDKPGKWHYKNKKLR